MPFGYPVHMNWAHPHLPSACTRDCHIRISSLQSISFRKIKLLVRPWPEQPDCLCPLWKGKKANIMGLCHFWDVWIRLWNNRTMADTVTHRMAARLTEMFFLPLSLPCPPTHTYTVFQHWNINCKEQRGVCLVHYYPTPKVSENLNHDTKFCHLLCSCSHTNYRESILKWFGGGEQKLTLRVWYSR